jgi:hypothetical protein
MQMSRIMIMGRELKTAAEFLNSARFRRSFVLKSVSPGALPSSRDFSFKLSGTRKMANAGSQVNKKARSSGGQGPVEDIMTEARAGEIRLPTILAPCIRMKLTDLKGS